MEDVCHAKLVVTRRLGSHRVTIVRRAPPTTIPTPPRPARYVSPGSTPRRRIRERVSAVPEVDSLRRLVAGAWTRVRIARRGSIAPWALQAATSAPRDARTRTRIHRRSVRSVRPARTRGAARSSAVFALPAKSTATRAPRLRAQNVSRASPGAPQLLSTSAAVSNAARGAQTRHAAADRPHTHVTGRARQRPQDARSWCTRARLSELPSPAEPEARRCHRGQLRQLCRRLFRRTTSPAARRRRWARPSTSASTLC